MEQRVFGYQLPDWLTFMEVMNRWSHIGNGFKLSEGFV